MDKVLAHLKKTWKVYLMGIWMIGVSGFLYHLNGQIQTIRQANSKLSSDVGSIESILISTDGNVADVKKQVDDMAGKMENVHRRVMRRR
jgi:allophanate hydrolase subunit 1